MVNIKRVLMTKFVAYIFLFVYINNKTGQERSKIIMKLIIINRSNFERYFDINILISITCRLRIFLSI